MPSRSLGPSPGGGCGRPPANRSRFRRISGSYWGHGLPHYRRALLTCSSSWRQRPAPRRSWSLRPRNEPTGHWLACGVPKRRASCSDRRPARVHPSAPGLDRLRRGHAPRQAERAPPPGGARRRPGGAGASPCPRGIGPHVDVARALEEAGRHARSRGAPDAAAELLELARTLTPPEDDAGLPRRSVAAAEYHFDAGDATRATALLEESIAMARPGRDRARLLFRLASISWLDMHRVQGLSEQALREVGDAGRETGTPPAGTPKRRTTSTSRLGGCWGWATCSSQGRW